MGVFRMEAYLMVMGGLSIPCQSHVLRVVLLGQAAQ
jgi:hypothetical protein